MKTPGELLRELNELDEGRRIEAKRGSAIGKSALETISAFSNTDGLGGGYLLFGVSREGEPFDERYHAAGVKDPDKIQLDLASQCSESFNLPVRPEIEREEIDGRVVIAAFIPEVSRQARPVYIKSRGLPHGAYLRIGSSDQRCTDRDVAKLHRDQSPETFDARLLERSVETDYSPEAVANYRRSRRARRSDAPELAYDDRELLRALRVVRQDEAGTWRFTIGGALLFGSTDLYRRSFPSQRADYIRVLGRKWLPGGEDRFTSVDLEGPIFETVYRLESEIMDYLPKKFTLPEGSLHRVDVPPVPRKAVREALVNALMHRDYEVYSPVQVIRYTNRIEFRNMGYSLKPTDQLGEAGSALRNPLIAGVLHETELAEAKGSGIRTMREEMRRADLPLPTFYSSREQNRFMTTLLMLHLLDPEAIEWLANFDDLELTRDDRQALIFAFETGEIRNEDYRNLGDADTLTASKALGRLRDLGLFEQRGAGSATHYVPTEKVLTGGQSTQAGMVGGEEISGVEGETSKAGGQTFPVEAESAQVEGQSEQAKGQTSRVKPQTSRVAGQTSGVDEGPEERGVILQGIPDSLVARLDDLGKKASVDRVRDAIVELCTVQPWSAVELAVIMRRSYEYLIKTHLRVLVDQRRLERTEPKKNAPNQKYRAIERAET